MNSLASCLFCKIIKGEIPSMKLLETEFSYAFLDIGPLSKGHSLVIPKYHGQKLHDIPDEYLADALPIAKKIALALGATDYNILQNNGKIAHQVVPHVHFHVIPKPSATDTEGLVIGWPTQKVEQPELQKLFEEIKGKL
ncbi:Hit family protein 1 OS=Saccharomyces cerevisiae (strain ATCC 204508 / S288c) GN=HNT1 PE=1 SV=2 [Rhizoctonia solani AG-1 IB]|uniref:Hit family protein 1 n=1 Tax=Thanatephorus cucumeris (strain AG1-IB / isolate 7/3/14) TaxID=1108050 RepID=M5C8Z1_THACB|nr:Hit family protein 1 [Rhizoctonia solani AG-1 IB]CEL56842.1 Hit family protein 1 OS=Saccharomyces cerevisiae (strain ATCC 204508 / S288c) GN=HNT1 PE=1 SV=2 [Rhizoctonia solani AG-1 IB]